MVFGREFPRGGAHNCSVLLPSPPIPSCGFEGIVKTFHFLMHSRREPLPNPAVRRILREICLLVGIICVVEEMLDGPTHLFDHANDPYQQANLAEDPAYSGVRERLSS